MLWATLRRIVYTYSQLEKKDYTQMDTIGVDKSFNIEGKLLV